MESSTVALAYDPAGRLARIDFPNAVATDVTYDAEGRPASIVHAQAPSELARFDYGFFADGLVQSIAEPGGTRAFTYDATQQLTAGGKPTAPEIYNYDAEGNRNSSHLSASHQHDAANRLIQDDSHCYAYDANGNLISKTELAAGACAGPMTAYSWDVRNRLVRIDFPDLTVATYRYDALDRRIEKDVGGVVTRYVYDDDDILLEFDGANALQARYGHGIEVDQPLVMERGGLSHFYHADHLGSIRLITDGAGLAVNGYDYDAFGNFEPTTVAPIASPYAFTAREHDPESGLHYYRARYYDPSIGRFIGEDPLACGSNDPNLYRYVFNTPVNSTDPNGEFELSQNAFLMLTALTATVTAVTIIVDGIEIDLDNPNPGPTTETIEVDSGQRVVRPPDSDCRVNVAIVCGSCGARSGFNKVLCGLQCAALTALCALQPDDPGPPRL